jgi:hypothetical protein
MCAWGTKLSPQIPDERVNGVIRSPTFITTSSGVVAPYVVGIPGTSTSTSTSWPCPETSSIAKRRASSESESQRALEDSADIIWPVR